MPVIIPLRLLTQEGLMAQDTGNRLGQARQISIGATRKQLNETIGGGDTADFFRFRLTDRSSSSFSLSGLRANADLALLDSRGRVVSQSRTSGNRPEQLNANLDAGVYYLRVTPRTRQDNTRYRLQYSATALPSLFPGQILLQAADRLGPGDAVLPSDNSLFDLYTFQGTAGQNVTLSLNSIEFDTYLILLDSSGTVLVQNDDISSSDRNSRISTGLPTNGTYIVIVNAYDSSGQGSYTLTITAP